MQTVMITGADRGLGIGLTKGLLERGWKVFAGQYLPEWGELSEVQAQYGDQLVIVPLDVSNTRSVAAAAGIVSKHTSSLDMLINNAGISARSGRAPISQSQNYADMQRIYNVNSLGPLRMVEAFLPLLKNGEMKRMCFVSSEAGSIARSHRTSGYGYGMSKSALNMGASILFNDLRPSGFTFRVYYPGWIRSYMSGTKGLKADLEPEEAAECALPIFLGDRNEDKLEMVDYNGESWPW